MITKPNLLLVAALGTFVACEQGTATQATIVEDAATGTGAVDTAGSKHDASGRPSVRTTASSDANQPRPTTIDLEPADEPDALVAAEETRVDDIGIEAPPTQDASEASGDEELELSVEADEVVSAPGHTGTGFSDATKAVNGVKGGGQGAGSTDVFSLGYEVGVDNFIVLSWTGWKVTNGPGPDFVVFENPFVFGGGVFMDQIVVELSRDGDNWVAFPFDYVAGDETVYSNDPDDWVGFAGVTPVVYNIETNPVDPFDQQIAGGDPFDLDGLPDDGAEGSAIKAGGFAFLRLVAAATVINPDTGEPFVHDSASNGPDIDGVIARYLVPQ